MRKDININYGNAALGIIAALPAEAKPLRKMWKMQQCATVSKFAVYAHSDKPIYLVQSGVGPIAAALATQALLSYVPDPEVTAIMNIGVAGAADAPLDSIWRVDKVYDVASNLSYYPGGIIKSDMSPNILTTRAKWQDSYPESGLLDMEASAVLETSSRFLPREQVEIIKIVIDNKNNKLQDKKTFNSDKVVALISKHQRAYESVADRLLDLVINEAQIKLSYTVDGSAFLKRWHFTFYQKNQLFLWLRCLQHKFSMDYVYSESVRNCSSAAQVLSLLQHDLSSQDYPPTKV